METAKKKEDIYKAIKLWLNDSPNKTKNFIDVDDPTLGILSFNMISSEYILTKITRAQIEYKITIEIKDGKFRYRASDFTQKINIIGSIITQSYKDFCDTSIIEKSILENEDLKKIETKERKLKNIDEKKEMFLNKAKLKKAAIKVDDVLKIGPFLLRIDPTKLTPDELAILNSEYEEFV